MKIKNLLYKLISEQESILKTSSTKPIVDAIKNRNPISFYYSGPRKPKKDSVKPGNRVYVEAVAIGLNKLGKLIIRGYVLPPSVSKKGFDKTRWRTYIVNRMSNVTVDKSKTFDIKRENYKEGDDGSMTVTYVTSNWEEKSTIKPEKITKPSMEPQVTKKEPEKTPDQLPQPKTKEKPDKEPEINSLTKYDEEVYTNLKSKIKDVNGQKTVSKQDYENSINDLYKKKEEEWKENQRKINGNTNPGEGTRNKFKNDSKYELDKLMSNDKVVVSDEPTQLQEVLKKFKHLIYH